MSGPLALTSKNLVNGNSPGALDGISLDNYTAVTYTLGSFEFIETPLFTRALEYYLDDDEYARLQRHLNEHPEAGAIVPGSGGVRKLRWAAQGGGKRGGLRVIYYLRIAYGEIWMLTLYGKNVRENIPPHQLRRIKEAMDDG